MPHGIAHTQLKPPAPCLSEAAQWVLCLCHRGTLHALDEWGMKWSPLKYDERAERFGLSDGICTRFLEESAGLKIRDLEDDSGHASPRPEIAELRTAPRESLTYRTLAFLGKGSAGKVFKSVDDRGRFWALKQHTRSSSAESRMRQEAALMQQLAHSNIVTMREALLDDAGRCIAIVMPLATCTLALRMKSFLSNRCLMGYLSDLHKALSHIHASRLVHLDVKPLNVFLYGRSAVLGDLGSVQRCGDAIEGLYACTRPYRPPEVLFGCTRSYYSMDAWSYGVLALEMAMQKEIPFGKGGVEQAQLVVSMLGPPGPVDARAMMAPWHRVTDATCRALEDASLLWTSAAERGKYWAILRDQSCCMEAFSLARNLLVYDAMLRLRVFEAV
jgi:serine/threonine protein kinase